MAAIFPKVQPVEFFKDDALKGERLVYEALQALPDDYRVYCNPRLNPREYVDPYDRAVDFIVIHPEKGMLAVDVKASEIVEEPNGALSEYQPHRQIYKIIDPVKQASKALQDLFDKCDPVLKTSIPFGVAVFFPETSEVEFTDKKSIYFFSETLQDKAAWPQLAARIDDIFPEPIGPTPRLKADIEKFCGFLKIHSDHYNPVKEQVKQLQNNVREAYKLPGKPAPKAGGIKKAEAPLAKPAPKPANDTAALLSAAMKAPVVAVPDVRSRAVDLAARKKKPQKNLKRHNIKPQLAAQKNKALVPALPRKPIVIKPAKTARITNDRDNVTWLYRLEEALRESITLSPLTWLGVIMAATALIIALYFMGRNAGFVLAYH